MADTYNGWKNYETWLVKLWMDNEEVTYKFYKAMAETYVGAEYAAYEFGQAIKNDIVNDQPVFTGVYADLLTAALDKVDFFEIAESYLAEAQEG